MRIRVTLKTIHERPSGHNLSAAFGGQKGDLPPYSEEIFCEHAKEHGEVFIKVFDLSAKKCGMDKGEFEMDKEVYAKIEQIIQDINTLHEKVYPTPPPKEEFSLAKELIRRRKQETQT